MHLAANRLRIARISSVGSAVIFTLQELLRRTNDRRPVAFLTTHFRDPGLQVRVEYVLEVPRHNEFYAMNCRKGNVQRVARLGRRHGKTVHESPRQRLGFIRGVKQFDLPGNLESFSRGIGVAVAAFIP